MPSPYSNIPKLPELNKQFNSRFGEILEDKRKIIIKGIDNDLNTVILRLTDDELKDNFENDFISRFDSLKNQLSSEKNIAVINGYMTQSDNVKNKCNKEVDKFIDGISLKEFTSLPLQGGLIASYNGIDIEAEYTMGKLNHTVNLPAEVINFINGV